MEHKNGTTVNNPHPPDSHTLNKKISPRFDIAVTFALFVVITVGIISNQALKQIEKQTRIDLKNKLETVLTITRESLAQWVRTRIENAGNISNTPEFRTLLSEQLQVPPKKEDLLACTAQLKMRRLLLDSLAQHRDLSFFILNRRHINIMAAHDEEVGRINQLSGQKDYLTTIFNGHPRLIIPFLFTPAHSTTTPSTTTPSTSGETPPNKIAAMFVGTPIYNNDREIVAALLIRIDPAKDFSRIIRLARTGKTGDTYAFDEEGHLISQCNFPDQLFGIGLLGPNTSEILTISLRDPGGNMLNGFKPTIPRDRLPFTLMVTEALKKKPGINLDGYRDYRGVPVVGAWLWDTSLSMGLTYEIDVSEAYAAFFSIRRILLTSLAAVLVLFMLLVGYLIHGRRNAVKQATILDELVQKRTKELTASNDALQKAKKEADSANQLKSLFLSNMSHDIRTPLNGILGYSDLLIKNNPDQKTIRYLNTINKLGENLLVLINDILDLSKIEADQLLIHPQTFALKPFLGNLESLFAVQFQQKHLKLHFFIEDPLPTHIHQDQNRLLQVLGNLLNNAHKYTQQGTVTFTVSHTTETDTLNFSIKDTGIGIHPDHLRIIFEPFTQLATKAEPEHRGAGLGLPICRQLVRLMGGTIEVNSTPGIGSEFKISLPAHTNLAEETPHQEAPLPAEISVDQTITQKTILIVDDNIVNREVLREQLEHKGFHALLSAESGEEGIAVAMKHQPDLVLMDIQMPGIDGNEAIRRLRKMNFTNPIIALSAYAMQEEIDLSMQAGTDTYITKPINFDQLFITLPQLLRQTPPEPPQNTYPTTDNSSDNSSDNTTGNKTDNVTDRTTGGL